MMNTKPRHFILEVMTTKTRQHREDLRCLSIRFERCWQEISAFWQMRNETELSRQISFASMRRNVMISTQTKPRVLVRAVISHHSYSEPAKKRHSLFADPGRAVCLPSGILNVIAQQAATLIKIGRERKKLEFSVSIAQWAHLFCFSLLFLPSIKRSNPRNSFSDMHICLNMTQKSDRDDRLE